MLVKTGGDQRNGDRRIGNTNINSEFIRTGFSEIYTIREVAV